MSHKMGPKSSPGNFILNRVIPSTERTGAASALHRDDSHDRHQGKLSGYLISYLNDPHIPRPRSLFMGKIQLVGILTVMCCTYICTVVEWLGRTRWDWLYSWLDLPSKVFPHTTPIARPLLCRMLSNGRNHVCVGRDPSSPLHWVSAMPRMPVWC